MVTVSVHPEELWGLRHPIPELCLLQDGINPVHASLYKQYRQ